MQKPHKSVKTHQALKQPHPSPPEFNQATPNAYQMIALYLCNDMTLSLTKALHKKLAGPTGATGLPYGPACCAPRVFVLEFSLISVNSRKLLGAHD